jgi:hypothetical protein
MGVVTEIAHHLHVATEGGLSIDHPLGFSDSTPHKY